MTSTRQTPSGTDVSLNKEDNRFGVSKADTNFCVNLAGNVFGVDAADNDIVAAEGYLPLTKIACAYSISGGSNAQLIRQNHEWRINTMSGE